MTMKKIVLAVAVALVVGGSAVAQVVPHADTQLAQELFRLKQVDAIKAKMGEAKGTAGEELWKAELILATWDDAAKDKSEKTRQYLDSLSAYLKATAAPDGGWALAQGQFILTKLSQPIITRMEYWANNAKDRVALAPLAALAGKLLEGAIGNLEAVMKAAEAKQPFDEKAYMRAYGAAAEAKYYGAWATYFKAMAMDPAAPERSKLLGEAASSLNEWAVDDTDNGVNFQAYLLRGKIYSEAHDIPKALLDFAKAENEKAPGWVQYQARYQTVVANVRAKDFKAAQGSLEALKKSIAKENTEAQLSADMLGYRVASAIAESRTSESEKKAGRLEALGMLSAIVEKDPRFKDLVYEQLAAQVPADADVNTLLPMQQLAVAHFDSQGQKGDTPESRKQLKQAVDAAMAARANKDAKQPDKLEATYLVGVCNAVLGNLPEAAKYSVAFAEEAPASDERAKQMTELALQKLGDLAQVSNGGKLSPEMRELALKALKLSIERFGMKEWRYREALMLEEDGAAGDAAKLAQAKAVYEGIGPEDKNFLDARYRLVSLATTKFGSLPASTGEAAMQAAAQEVFKACSGFIGLLDHPPASADKEALTKAQGYRYDIWIIEAATAVNAAVHQPDVALNRLAKLDAAKDKLSEQQRGAVLRYKIMAYQMANQPDKAFAVVQEYAKANGQDAMAVIRSMALSTLDEINKVEATDPEQAKRLATYVVQLFDPIIKQAMTEGKGDTAFEYRLIQGDMMVRAGQAAEAGKLALALEAEKPGDIRPYMMEARAIYAGAEASKDKAEYAKAQDYFTRILGRLSPGSEGFWECWLRIVDSMEAQRGDAAKGEITQKLKDLQGIYGTKFGGEMFKKEFGELMQKYGV
jgi:hypothetical protein